MFVFLTKNCINEKTDKSIENDKNSESFGEKNASKISEKISEIDEYDELDNSVYLGDNPDKI